MPYWSSGSATSPPGGTSTTKFNDNSSGDQTTYEHVTNSGADAVITAYYDFGTVVTGTTLEAEVYYLNGSGTSTFQYSTDGSTWTNASVAPISGATGWQNYSVTLSRSGAVTFRYVRVIFTDSNAGVG
jgi:hypothetical protein